MINMMRLRKGKSGYSLLNVCRNCEGGNSPPSRNSPGMVRGEPKTDSEMENLVYSLGTEQRPRRTRGRCRNQSKPARQVHRAVLRDH